MLKFQYSRNHTVLLATPIAWDRVLKPTVANITLWTGRYVVVNVRCWLIVLVIQSW